MSAAGTGDLAGGRESPVAVITGAAGAIGSTYARALSGAGYRLVLADLKEAGKLAAEVAESGPAAIAVATDVSDADSARAMAEAAVGEFGRIDLLVNNAAYFSQILKKPVEQITVAEWDLAFAVNVRGAWLCACAVLPAMRAQGGGKIVNTSSMTIHGGGIEGFAHYASTKAAIVGLTRCLAREFGQYNICVNTISPDYTAHDGPLFDQQPEMEQRLAALRAIKRPGRPEDLVGTLLFLASAGADFVTGQDFWVNGGRIFS